MANLGNLSSLVVEDFPSQKSWIPRLLSPLNQFFARVSSALNNGLTFSENMSAVVKTIAVPQGSAATVFPLYFAWTLKSKPLGLWVVSAYESNSSHTNFTAAISADWEFTTDGKVKINGFPGLPTTAAFNVTIVAITG